jgi:pyridinium-3,5-bisthiocarboxylic acid mononucleotide nickel chelatase
MTDPKKPRFTGILRPLAPAHAHAPTHSHSPGHSHSHSPDVRGADPLRFGNPRLPRAAGVGKLLHFDCFSGVAGDMTVAALVDLGVPFEVVTSAVAAVLPRGVALSLRAALTGVIGGVRFVVEPEGMHPERSYVEIQRLLEAAALDDDTRGRALAIFRRLAEAEAFVHRSPLEAVSFHEVGAVDAIADIVGAAAALAYLGAEMVCAPLPLGHGSVVCRHGRLPLPAPATVACLKGVPTYDAGIEAELVTPTGAAIVASQARAFERWPALQPLAIGWGAGTRVLPDRLNALRVVLGEPVATNHEVPAATTHVVLEANVDDMTGELTGHAIAKLLESGALDAWAAPITMKKGRPGLSVSALCTNAAAAVIEAVLLRETSSIGLRRYGVSRSERPREIIEIETEFGTIPVKVARGPYGPPQLKPEFDACAAAAAAHSVPVRVVLAAALAAATSIIGPR